MRWIPADDLPGITTHQLVSTTHALDTASLGGTVRGVIDKEEVVRDLSTNFDAFIEEAQRNNRREAIRKVSSFIGDFSDALHHLRRSTTSTAHWVITTGNRTAAGLTVPFDAICKDIVTRLGGKPIASLRRQLPSKRMPSRNSQGVMITSETTMVVEFA
jgi:hypothetical protein